MSECDSVFVHQRALCESKHLGKGTKVWAFAHVMSGARIGENCNICDYVFVETGVVIGDRVTVKNNAILWEGVELEDDVFIGPAVLFTNDRRPRSPRMTDNGGVTERYLDKSRWLVETRVGKGASVGAGAIIVAGAEIGPFAFVAAGSLVTETVLPHSYVSGHPASHRGWVCCCGKRLSVGKDEKCVCEACQCHFKMLDGKVVMVD